MKKFDAKTASVGDQLALARDTRIRLTYRGPGFDGQIIARWNEPVPGRPSDAILRQRDVVVLEGGDA